MGKQSIGCLNIIGNWVTGDLLHTHKHHLSLGTIIEGDGDGIQLGVNDLGFHGGIADGGGDWFSRKLQDLCQVMSNKTYITPTIVKNGCLGLALNDKLLHGKHDGDGFTVVTSGDL